MFGENTKSPTAKKQKKEEPVERGERRKKCQSRGIGEEKDGRRAKSLP